ncbi:transcriptional regulator with XRE-family HTH domain [Streptomyces aurantiacus]|uniref:helix-turn-helix domain-containing protein n=1 Tax=Streptomyces aurantiacus TaxID=47760 RepID=UPI00278CE3D5|nr:helix-turn-helix transcriptional regulator [Streptomyces aurantiacus]MDQ0777368.1 transcriptional regulator with XRE-family HTH domain [Streptomyces aurantiacus]
MANGSRQAELGYRVFVSGGYIGQFEQAIRKPQLDVAARIDEVLQTDGFFERLWRKLIKDQPYTEYFAHVLSGNLLAEPAVVRRTQSSYDPIRAAVLPPEAPLALIESAAEDHRGCASST